MRDALWNLLLWLFARAVVIEAAWEGGQSEIRLPWRALERNTADTVTLKLVQFFTHHRPASVRFAYDTQHATIQIPKDMSPDLAALGSTPLVVNLLRKASYPTIH